MDTWNSQESRRLAKTNSIWAPNLDKVTTAIQESKRGRLSISGSKTIGIQVGGKKHISTPPHTVHKIFEMNQRP